MLKEISGGVCAAKGFKAAGVHCGVKANSNPNKNDLAIILSEKECSAAATYTLNRVKAAPIYVCMEHLEDGVEVVFPEDLLNIFPKTKQEAIVEVLRQDPRPQYHDDPTRKYGVAFAGHDVRFTVENGVLTVFEVVKLK